MASKNNERVREAAASLMGEPNPKTLTRLKKLEQAIAKNPKDPKPLVKKGKTLECMFKFGPALKCYDQALASKPKDLSALLAKASLLARSCREGQAVKVLDLAIAAGGNGAGLSFEQGRILHELGRLKRAEPYYARCLQLKPHHKKAVTNLACLWMKRKNPKRALAFLARAVKGNGYFAEQALKDRTLAGLKETARFWRIVMTGTYLADATLWWLQKKFKIKTF